MDKYIISTAAFIFAFAEVSAQEGVLFSGAGPPSPTVIAINDAVNTLCVTECALGTNTVTNPVANKDFNATFIGKYTSSDGVRQPDCATIQQNINKGCDNEYLLFVEFVGTLAYYNSPVPTELTKGLLKKSPVFLFDYGISTNIYCALICSARNFAIAVFNYLNPILKSCGLTARNLHCVGFSIGSTMCKLLNGEFFRNTNISMKTMHTIEETSPGTEMYVTVPAVDVIGLAHVGGTFSVAVHTTYGLPSRTDITTDRTFYVNAAPPPNVQPNCADGKTNNTACNHILGNCIFDFLFNQSDIFTCTKYKGGNTGNCGCSGICGCASGKCRCPLGLCSCTGNCSATGNVGDNNTRNCKCGGQCGCASGKCNCPSGTCSCTGNCACESYNGTCPSPFSRAKGIYVLKADNNTCAQYVIDYINKNPNNKPGAAGGISGIAGLSSLAG